MKKFLIFILLIGLIGLTYTCSMNKITDSIDEPQTEEPVPPVVVEEPQTTEPDPPVVVKPEPEPETIEPETVEAETIEPETTEPDPVDPAPEPSGPPKPVVTKSGFAANIELTDPGLRLYKGVVDPRSIDPYVLTNVTQQSVVNKFNILPWDYAPTNLVEINANGVGGMLLQKEAAESWEKWRLDALNDGYTVLAVSSYRSRDYQAGLFNNYLANHGDEAILWSAYPRRSEHELGLVLDLSHDWSIPGEGFIDTPMGKYLSETAHKYGFILRYPKGYESDTGYTFEPWHYRYVGTDISEKMNKENIPTLEHYYKLTVGQQ